VGFRFENVGAPTNTADDNVAHACGVADLYSGLMLDSKAESCQSKDWPLHKRFPARCRGVFHGFFLSRALSRKRDSSLRSE